MNRFFYFLVYLCFLATPLESWAIFKDFSIFKLVTLLLFGAKLLTKGNIFDFKEPFLIIFLIYAIFTILSSIWSIDREATLHTSLLTVLPSFIITLIIYYAIQDKGIHSRIHSVGMLVFLISLIEIVAIGISIYIHLRK